jgi:hypothetical protein
MRGGVHTLNKRLIEGSDILLLAAIDIFASTRSVLCLVGIRRAGRAR